MNRPLALSDAEQQLLRDLKRRQLEELFDLFEKKFNKQLGPHFAEIVRMDAAAHSAIIHAHFIEGSHELLHRLIADEYVQRMKRFAAKK